MDTGVVGQAQQVGLHRLETFLAQDPGNQSLQVAVFEAALRCSDWDKARARIDAGLRSQADALAWRIREGDLLLAQKRYAEARDALLAIDLDGLPSAASDAIVHNVAYTHFGEGNFAQAIAALEPRMSEQLQGAEQLESVLPPSAELQKLWMRALHHSRDVERAFGWAKAADESGGLSVRAAGVASLVALDATEAEFAKKWARACIEEDINDVEKAEAFVTWSTLLLGNQDIRGAREFADRALALNDREGRAWSVIGFAQLLAEALTDAQVTFARALESIPDHVGTWHGLGWAQLAAGSHEAALATFQRALALDRNFAESHGAVAVALIYMGHRQAASEHVDRAQGLDKTSLSGHYARALLNGEVRDQQTLQRLAKRLLAGREGPSGGTMDDWLRKP